VFIPESDYREKRQGQVSTEVLQFVPDLEAADSDHHGRRGWEQRADDDAPDEHTPERQNQGAPRSSGGIPSGHCRVVVLHGSFYRVTEGRDFYFRPKTYSSA
jgi:hypothetical protein